MDEIEYYAATLAMGAKEYAFDARLRQLEVRRLHISGRIGEWEPYRRTLSNQVRRGSYAVIQMSNGSRMVYTTTARKAEVATLQRWTGRPLKLFKAESVPEMEELLLSDLQDVFSKAKDDKRTRRITARGFDPERQLKERRRQAHFWEVAVGREQLDPDEAFQWVMWWESMIGNEIRLQHRGTPVPDDVWNVIPEDERYFHSLVKAGSVKLELPDRLPAEEYTASWSAAFGGADEESPEQSDLIIELPAQTVKSETAG